MVINHNLASMNANRMLGNTNLKVGKASEKLASGYRINRSADDAAGLAISEKMRSQIRGLTRASRNVSDAISLVQTAEGALQETQNMLQRINELAVQAASDTNAALDRESLQCEVAQLIDEVDQIAGTTRFNETLLLDGRFGKATGGTATNPLVAPNIYFTDVDIAKVETTQVVEGQATASGYDKVKEALKTQIVPNAVTAVMNTFSSTFGYLSGSDIGIGLSVITDPSTLGFVQVTSYFNPYTIDIQLAFTLGVNFGAVETDNSDDGLSDAGRAELESTITHEMLHALMFEAMTCGMIGRDEQLVGEEAFPGWFREGMAQAAGGGAQYVTSGLRINGNSTDAQITAALNNNKMTGNTVNAQYATGYLAVMYLGYLAAGGTSIDPNTVATGLDTIMTDLKTGYSLNETIERNTNGKYTNMDAFENGFANDAEAVSFVKDLMQAAGSGLGSVVTGDYTATNLLSDTDGNHNIFKLNTEKEEVRNVYPDDYQVLTGGTAVGTGVDLNGNAPGTVTPTPDPGAGGGGTTPDPGTGGGTTPDPGTGGGTGTGGTTGGGTGGTTGGGTTGGGTGGGTVTPQGGIQIQSGAEKGDTTVLHIEKMNAEGLGIKNIDISTRDGASSAIDVARGAINKISEQRAELGAMQNRLEHKLNNLGNTVENLTAAESNIRDADMASEMTKLQKHQIILQAGYAMVAQANALPQNVLSLLGA